MGESVESRLIWTELGVHRPGWVVTGSFAVGGANYHATFLNADELDRFLDFLFASPHKPATSRLFLHPNVVPRRTEDQLSNLRFQFDLEHGVAAAVLLVAVDDEVLQWRTKGSSVHSGAVLAHDSWNEHETLFPPESFITMTELRQAVVDWGFGEQVPPDAVRWVRTEGIDWF